MIAIITKGLINHFPLEIHSKHVYLVAANILFQDINSRKIILLTQVVMDEGSVQCIISQYKTLLLIHSNLAIKLCQ